MNTTLELTSTFDLIEELAKRFDAMVLNGMTRREFETEAGRMHSVRAWRIKGDPDLCVSLAAVLEDMTIEGLRGQSAELPPAEL